MSLNGREGFKLLGTGWRTRSLPGRSLAPGSRKDTRMWARARRPDGKARRRSICSSACLVSSESGGAGGASLPDAGRALETAPWSLNDTPDLMPSEDSAATAR